MNRNSQTRYLRGSRMPTNKPPEGKQNVIPIYQTGGIGDLIVSLPWLNSFRDSPIKVRIYTSYPEVAKIFLDWPEILANETPNFDYYIVSSDVSNWKFKTTPPNTSVLPPYLLPKYEAWLQQVERWRFVIDGHPGRANDMASCAVNLGLHRWDLPFEFIDVPYKPFKWDIDGVTGHDFITVHDGFDKHLKFDRSMKSWPTKHWFDFIKSFKARYGGIKVIQLGGAKDKPLPGVDECLIGKLSFLESLRYLKSASLHVDTDSGLVHARRLLGQKSIVLFGPTNYKYFGYPENINIVAPMCGNCWWMKKDWMEKCVLAHPKALCMESITPAMVMDKIEIS